MKITLTATMVTTIALAALQPPTYADIAEQIAACPGVGCVIELEPGKTYVETRPWNLRGMKHLSILGNGATVYFNFAPDDPPTVAIDASGTFGLHFEGWGVALGSRSGRPEVGLLLARNINNDSSGEHHFARWRIRGWYTKAAIVSIASEMNVWLHSWLSNSHPGAAVYWTGRDNILGISSQFGRFGVGSTNTCHDFMATGFGQYGHVYGDNANGASIVIAGGTHDLHIRGGTMSMRYKGEPGTTGSLCAIKIGTPPGRGARSVNRILLDGVEWETVGARYSVLIVGKVSGLTIRDCLLQSTGDTLHVAAGATLSGLLITGGRQMAGLGGRDGE